MASRWRPSAGSIQGVSPAELPRAWSWEPTVLVGLALAGLLYARGVRDLWQRAGLGRGLRRWQPLAFAGGLLAIFVALISPLDALSEALFTAHMLQHLLLIVLAAPLLVLAEPLGPFLRALSPDSRRGLSRLWRRSGPFRAVWRLLSLPGVA